MSSVPNPTKRAKLARRLQPHVVYSVLGLQQLVEIPVMELIIAASRGGFRFLGEGREMHILGQDVIDWLEGKPQWRCSEATRLQADTVRHVFPRSISQLSIDRVVEIEVADADTIDGIGFD